jgi:hypothetical protein
MKRLLNQCVLVAAVLLLIPVTAPAQETWADRQAERAERARQRAEERAERARARAERFADWHFETTNGAHILIAKRYTLPEGSVAKEGIVVVGEDATIDGTVENDVLVVGGRLRVGPKAVIHGDVATIGGELDLDPSARIDGDVNTTRIRWPDWDWNWGGWPVIPRIGDVWWEGAALAFTIGRFVLILFLSVLLVAVAPRWTGSIASRMTGAPLGSAIAGFAAEIFFAPAMVILAIALIITIVGIPLLAGMPFLLAAFALLWVAGYAAVAGVLGARLRGSDRYFGGLRPLDVVLGSFMLSSISMVGQVLMMGSNWLGPFALLVRGTGWTIEYIAWTIGLGAALTAWLRPGGFDTRAVPPVTPPLPTPSPSAL